MGGHWVWWIAAAILIGAELLTGTFYLLAIGIAAALGGVTALAGASEPVQFAVAPPQQSLDVGQAVQVLIWNPDGTARVGYRGSEWDAELASAGTPHAETMYIVGTRANVLVLSERKPAT